MNKPTAKQEALLKRLQVTAAVGWVMRSDLFYPARSHDVETLNSLLELGWIESECSGKVLRLTQEGTKVLTQLLQKSSPR